MNPIAVDPGPFYEQRVIIFIETGPQTNKYHQVFLDRDQFISITANLGKPAPMPETAPPDSIHPVLIESDDDYEYTFHTEIRSIKHETRT